MKSYTITVNGKAYAVTVEEGAAAGVAPVAAAPAPVAPAAPAPAAAPARRPGSGSSSGWRSRRGEGFRPMPGKVVGVKASVGQAVKKGDTILVLEAMKMENDIVAPQDGTVASINVSPATPLNPARF